MKTYNGKLKNTLSKNLLNPARLDEKTALLNLISGNR
jgi:hypothetical protein